MQPLCCLQQGTLLSPSRRLREGTAGFPQRHLIAEFRREVKGWQKQLLNCGRSLLLHGGPFSEGRRWFWKPQPPWPPRQIAAPQASACVHLLLQAARAAPTQKEEPDAKAVRGKQKLPGGCCVPARELRADALLLQSQG